MGDQHILGGVACGRKGDASSTGQARGEVTIQGNCRMVSFETSSQEQARFRDTDQGSVSTPEKCHCWHESMANTTSTHYHLWTNMVSLLLTEQHAVPSQPCLLQSIHY